MNTGTVRNPSKLVHKLAEASRTVLPRYFTPDCCIAATRVTILVLERFGITADPQPVQVTVLNPAYRARCDSGRPCPDEESLCRAWGEDGSWTVGIGHGFEGAVNPLKWPGHLIAVTGGGRVAVDLTLGQADRPARGIRLGPAVFGLTREFHAGECVWVDVNGCAVGYRRKAEPPGPSGFTGAPDWRNERGQLDRAVRDLYMACR